jgi:hypothetical protein
MRFILPLERSSGNHLPTQLFHHDVTIKKTVTIQFIH